MHVITTQAHLKIKFLLCKLFAYTIITRLCLKIAVLNYSNIMEIFFLLKLKHKIICSIPWKGSRKAIMHFS